MRRAVPGLLALCLFAAGCGANVEQDDARASTTKIENCGRTVEYPKPKRPIAYDMSATEKMFALGLADQMRGYVMPTTANAPVKRSPYLDDYRRVDVLGTDVMSKEVVVDSKADWVLAGWNSGFSEERGITPKLLGELGIYSYMYTESCFNYGDAKKQQEYKPSQAMYKDLRDIAKIFGVEDRAEKLVADIEKRTAALAKTHPDGAPARVFLYDSGTDQPFTSGGLGAPSEIIDQAGGRSVTANVRDRWTEVGWESVVKSRPEVIVVVDYGDQPAEEKIEFLKSHRGLASSPAVKNNRFHVMDYGEVVTGPRNIDAAEKLGKYLRSIDR